MPSAAGAAGAGGEAAVPCEHTFSYASDASPSSVHVSGSFNEWDDPGTALSFDAQLQAFTVKLELEPATYEYKFVLNGATWITDPGNARTVSDASGNVNSVVTVDCP